MIKTVMQPVKPRTIDPSELEGHDLDHAVAQALGVKVYPTKRGEWMTANYGDFNPRLGIPYWRPSKDWRQGGPIIQSEGISVVRDEGDDYWQAVTNAVSGSMLGPGLCGDSYAHGPTPLIAAMRCFVASKGVV